MPSSLARFIPDGYTRHARFAPSPLHPALAIEYRPMLSGDRALFLRRIARLAPEGRDGMVAAEVLTLQELAARLVSWTRTNAKGNLVPITPPNLRRVEPPLLATLANVVLGLGEGEDERDRARDKNLVEGVRLRRFAPALAARDCTDCQQFVYDERTGRRQRHAGAPVRRPKGTVPPCRLPHVGCLKGTPESPRTLTPENVQAYLFHRACQAIGQFPDDPIVRRNARLLEEG
ncbi:MAG: hypothetical protein ACKV0T_02750 [Planctomycetales bacterium]